LVVVSTIIFDISTLKPMLYSLDMVLETAIKVSMEVKEALREKLMEQETFNELITEMFNRLAQQGWREITSPNRR
jgi:hypothetical protein